MSNEQPLAPKIESTPKPQEREVHTGFSEPKVENRVRKKEPTPSRRPRSAKKPPRKSKPVIPGNADPRDGPYTMHLFIPPTRVKRLVSLDPEIHHVSKDGNLAITRATELFLSLFARKVEKLCAFEKRVTLTACDVEQCIEDEPKFEFLKVMPRYTEDVYSSSE